MFEAAAREFKMKQEFLCNLILLTIALLNFGLKLEAQVKETDRDVESVATLQGIVTDSKGKPIKGAIVTTKPPTSEVVTQADGSYKIFSVVGGAYEIIAKTSDNRVGTTNIYVVTADRNVIPEIQIRVRDSETLSFQNKLQQRWSAILTSFALFPVGAGITIGFAERKFRSSADDAKREYSEIIPISTSDYQLKMRSWEQYRKKETRANWLAITAGNLMLDAVPFYWHWIKGQPIGWKLALIYYGPQVVTLGSWSIIDFIRAENAQKRVEELQKALRYHEATVHQGEKGKFRERAEWLAMNAVLDAAFGALAWRLCSHQNYPRSADLRLRYRMSPNQVALSVAGVF